MTDYGDELAPGTRLEEFEIERTLGTGGFGVTYLAWDRSLDRRVAIKEYLPRDWGSRRADGSVGPRATSDVQDYQWGLDRFLAEARILAQLEHPHIVRAHRVISAAHGTAYMVMEYVEGQSLREELATEGTLSEARVRHILRALTAGLEPVHAKGLLHRDIKPANVMLRIKDDTPVLIDFGAARQVIGQQSRSVTSVLTPGYAPIELYETHGHQGPWTDIYALGALAYVSLTGRLPEDATSRVRNDRLRPLGAAAGEAVSQGLEMAVAAALRVNESDRPQDLGAWRTLLDMAAGEDIASVMEESAPAAEESTPARADSAAERTPAASSVLFAADLETPASVSRSRLYGVAAGIAGAALLGILLVLGARSGDVGTDTGTLSGAAADDGAGDAATATDGGAGGTVPDAESGGAAGGGAPDAGTAVDVGGGAEPSTEIAGNEPTGGIPDDRRDVAQAEAALGLDRDDRRVVQERLVAAGFDPGVPDGTFGDRTRAALREWQAAQGMEETGYLDGASAEALAAAALAAEAPAAEALVAEAASAETPAVEAASAEIPAVEAASAEVVVAELERSPSPSPDPPTTTPLETPDDDPVPTPRPSPPPSVEPTRDVDSPPAPRTVFRSCADCPEMVVVPPGTFRMGSSEGEGDERPVHNVRVGIFAMGRYEVTRGEYSSFVTATDHAGAACDVVDGRGENLNRDSRASWRNPGFGQADDHPVVCIGWEDALAYARWLSRRTGQRYRLPSEAEWEYAARAETVTGRYWDGGSTGQCGNANGGDRTLARSRGSWTPSWAGCLDGSVHTAQVGAYAPNAFRLHDMLGNVWEWVADCWHGNYEGAPAGGSAWRGGNCSGRVLRGGAWNTTPRGLRTANRLESRDGRAENTTGFRVVREFRGRAD